MSKCYDNPDYDDLGSDIQNAWEQHKPEQDFKDIELPQQERQETLEELIENEGYPKGITQEVWEDGVRLGAKWQQERSYSEEDLKEAFGMNDKDWICFEEWFEQFKKK